MRTRDENKEQAIREKAMEMIVKEGFDGLSMQKLAKAAGVSPATIYIYFKDREDLIIQLCRKTGQEMMEASLSDFNPEMSFEEGMKVQWRNRARYSLQYPLEVQFLEQIKHSNLHEQAMEIPKSNFRQVMKQFVLKARANNELIELPFEVYWSVAFAPLYQLLKFNTHGKSYQNKTFKLTDKVIMQTLDLVLKAMKPTR